MRTRVRDALREIAGQHPGIRLERKPASVAVHTRGVDPQIAAAAIEAVRIGPATWDGVTVTQGKEVIELSVVATHKGTAVDQLRTQLAASAVLFIGDDVTDENAFGNLHGPDLGIKIGPGDTQADYRVADPLEAARALGLLLETRRHWLFGERAVPIERHSMLSNGRTVALLTPEAKISWLCHPKPDSAAIFADLVGGSPAGHFSITPERGGIPLGQRYRSGTMTVETRWSGLTVTDWLDKPARRPPRTARGGHRRLDPGAGAHRQRQDPAGVRATARVRPGRRAVAAAARRPAGARLQRTDRPLLPGVQWQVGNDGGYETAKAVVDLNAAGGQVVLELRFGTHSLEHHRVPIQDRQAAAEQPWKDWVASLRLPSTARDLVARSALTLRGLCHEATGSILARRPPRSPRNWAASATGTTATAGCATRH
ncbi:hypothetical protein GCM10027614_33130 [Micromonospora vulcania]